MTVKIIGAALLGIVIGAAIGEIIRKEKSEIGKDLGGKIKKSLGAMKEAFREGYQQATATQEDDAAEASAAG